MHDKLLRQADVWRTCNKIRAAVFRVGINLWDWYRPLDPEGNSLISESKFVSVLAGGLRSVVGLSNAEVQQLAAYFRAQDGRVLYTQLCRLVHGEDPGPAKTSTECILEACPPPPEPACRKLDEGQTRRLCCLLATLAQRDLPLKPYFQDYELVAKNDGRITFAHFARILNYAKVLVSPEDFNLLVRRFIRDSYTLDYVEFLKAVEAVRKEGIRGLGPEYNNPKAVIDTALPKLSRPEIEAGMSTRPLGGTSTTHHPALDPPKPTRTLIESMLRVQEYVLKRRVRVSEFLRDYDPLNCGRITPQQFVRALGAMGISTILSGEELRCVTQHYTDPNDPHRVCWRTFEDDCDQVFTVKELEKHPELCVTSAVPLPARGSAEERGGLTEPQLDAAQAALLRLRNTCNTRHLDLRPAFGDHDRLKSGHVLRTHVSRVLARLGVLMTAAQLRALEDRYLDDCGFNYFALLEELEEQRPESVTSPSAAVAHARRVTTPAPTPDEQTNIVLILAKIKGKMVREGIRPREFLQQFDKKRELVIPRADFYRGLAAAGVSLTPLEMDTLMEVFCAPGRRRYVEYERFCGCVGEALTQAGLERSPLLTPVPHVPVPPTSFLNFEERAIVSTALTKLANHPDQLSNIREVFNDSDRARCGTVSKSCVQRALCRRGLLAVLSARELDLVCKCFAQRRGCDDEVNYRALCNALDLLHATARAQPC
ncbi:uncharacterized protein LOC121740621 [Aricia agestis]|uniref:uncharacterized protein LOC121740621 n=1 Tax=Aricia agestis TaxID=91739 RepID=UPI001C209E98|nr:uncharacterized protein LOC121740621 [Aricia agestis]